MTGRLLPAGHHRGVLVRSSCHHPLLAVLWRLLKPYGASEHLVLTTLCYAIPKLLAARGRATLPRAQVHDAVPVHHHRDRRQRLQDLRHRHPLDDGVRN